MSTSDKVKAVLALNGKRQTELADFFGMTRQSMSNKVLRDSWSAEDLKKVAAFVGCDCFFEMQDGQRIYLFSQTEKGRFKPPIANQGEVTQIGDDPLDDPAFSKEEVKMFRRLEKRISATITDKYYRGEYTANRFGMIEIPAISNNNKPHDVSEKEWRRFMAWRFRDQKKKDPDSEARAGGV